MKTTHAGGVSKKCSRKVARRSERGHSLPHSPIARVSTRFTRDPMHTNVSTPHATAVTSPGGTQPARTLRRFPRQPARTVKSACPVTMTTTRRGAAVCRASSSPGPMRSLFNIENIAKPFISVKDTLNEGIASFYDESSGCAAPRPPNASVAFSAAVFPSLASNPTSDLTTIRHPQALGRRVGREHAPRVLPRRCAPHRPRPGAG